MVLPEKETVVIADIQGMGAIQHIWMTPVGQWRNTILRICWEDNENPSVECPVGDFFCCGWQEYFQISSLPICVNPRSGLNCYWSMPFRKRCKITLENRDEKPVTVYYQIDYTLTEVPEDYFCGSYNFENPQTHDGYVPFSTPYTGLQVVNTDKLYQVQKRFGLYRFHIMDLIRFEKDLKVTIQALGWREGGRYLPLQDDISSVAFWYQDLPCAPFPKLPDKDYLEII